MSAWVVLGGLLVGFLVGLTGVGGGSLLTPVLVLSGVPTATAVGTDLVCSAATKLVGALQHRRQGGLDRPWVLALGIGGAPAALAGTLLVGALRSHPGAEQLLRHLLGAVLVAAAGGAVLQELVRRRPRRRPGGPPWLGVPFGALIGLLVGLTSIGSGSLVAPVLLLGSGLPARRVVGTDLAYAFLLTLVAGAAHAAIGTVDYRLAANLLLGSLPGVWLGSRLTLAVPGQPLRAVVSGLVLLTGLRFLT